jgi:hypothetical protein
MIIWLFVLTIVFVTPFVGQIFPKQQLDYPDRTVRLPPTAFPGFPKDLVHELQRRGCMIPQTVPQDEKSNVIKGAFLKPGQTDWAVLCSKKGSTSLLMFWNGSATNSAELGKIADDPNRIFDWFIRPVGWKFIMNHYRAYGGPKPPPIDHYGIESGGEKASSVMYFYHGKWITLQGAD